MLILAALAVLMCLSRVLHGAFAADDWAYRAQAHFTSFSSIISQQLQQDVRRPGAALYFATLFGLLGSHIKLLLALSATLRFFLAASLYGLLRELRFRWLDAVAIAALALLFPSSDSTWLWATASVVTVAVVCLLVGCLLNLRGVRNEGRHRLALRIAGLALIIAGILTYELVAAVGLASGALYFAQTGSRKALREWAIDLLVLGIVIVVFTLHAIPVLHGGDVHEVSSLSQIREHAHVILSQSATLMTHSLLPFGTPRNSTVLGMTGALTVLAFVVALMLRPKSKSRQALMRWLAVAASGLLVVGLGYLALVPSNIYYVPLQAGIGNRINAVSAVGYALIIYSVVALAGTLVFRELPHSRMLIAGFTVSIATVIGLGYLSNVDTDKTAWRQAGVLESAILSTLRSHVPPPSHGSSVVTLDAPTEAAPGIPVFSASWDLNAAVQLLWNDPTLKAYPMAPGMTITCSPTKLSVNIAGQPGWEAGYPVAVVDVTAGAVLTVKNLSTCVNGTTKLGVHAA
jgi:hypothetical protein